MPYEEAKRSTFSALKSGLIVGFTQAVILLVMLLALTFALGNASAEAVKVQKAIACELALPASAEGGRSEPLVVKCFVDQGLTPPALDAKP